MKEKKEKVQIFLFTGTEQEAESFCAERNLTLNEDLLYLANVKQLEKFSKIAYIKQGTYIKRPDFLEVLNELKERNAKELPYGDGFTG